jgi:hypothetical protein
MPSEPYLYLRSSRTTPRFTRTISRLVADGQFDAPIPARRALPLLAEKIEVVKGDEDRTPLSSNDVCSMGQLLNTRETLEMAGQDGLPTAVISLRILEALASSEGELGVNELAHGKIDRPLVTAPATQSRTWTDLPPNIHHPPKTHPPFAPPQRAPTPDILKVLSTAAGRRRKRRIPR